MANDDEHDAELADMAGGWAVELLRGDVLATNAPRGAHVVRGLARHMEGAVQKRKAALVAELDEVEDALVVVDMIKKHPREFLVGMLAVLKAKGGAL